MGRHPMPLGDGPKRQFEHGVQDHVSLSSAYASVHTGNPCVMCFITLQKQLNKSFCFRSITPTMPTSETCFTSFEHSKKNLTSIHAESSANQMTLWSASLDKEMLPIVMISGITFLLIINGNIPEGRRSVALFLFKHSCARLWGRAIILVTKRHHVRLSYSFLTTLLLQGKDWKNARAKHQTARIPLLLHLRCSTATSKADFHTRQSPTCFWHAQMLDTRRVYVIANTKKCVSAQGKRSASLNFWEMSSTAFAHCR